MIKNKVKIALFNVDNKLRNGWWIVIFLALIALTRPIYKPIKTTLSDIGVHDNFLELLAPLLILFVTVICTKLRKESMQSVGLGFNVKWLQQLSIGILAGTAMIIVLSGAVFLGGGVHFTINPSFEISILFTSLYLFFIGSFMEELLHRGFLFQRLINGTGIWVAQILIATVFAVGHWTNPGMEGTAKIIGFLDLFVGSLFFGLAYYKTKSLALPVGLHLGWNWCMGSVFGFKVSGHQAEGLLIPQLTNMPSWFTGGSFGLEGSVVSVLVVTLALIILWRWSGTKGAHKNAVIQ